MKLANRLWNRFGRLGLDDIPESARTVAGQCVLDWFGCAPRWQPRTAVRDPARGAGPPGRSVLDRGHGPPLPARRGRAA